MYIYQYNYFLNKLNKIVYMLNYLKLIKSLYKFNFNIFSKKTVE